MRKKIRLWSGAMIWLLAVACVPQPVSAPAAAPTPAPAATPQTSAEDDAWAKVVAAAKKEGNLVIYSFYFSGDIGRTLAQDFKNKYGIQVEILVGSSRTAVEKIKVERQMKTPIADILNSGLGSAVELVISGLATSVWQELPAMRDKSVFAFDPVFSPQGEILTYTQDISGVVAISSKLVRPQEEPKSFNELLDAKWKGKILSPDPRGAGGGVGPFYYDLRFFKVLDLDYYRQLARQDMVLWGASVTEALRMVARGEYPLYVGSSDGTVAPLVAEGAPIKALAMKEGSIGSGNSITMVKDPAHPNVAKLFINWLLSQEGSLAYAKAAHVTSLRRDVPDMLIEGARVKPTKLFPRTWETEEWYNKDVKAGTMVEVFGKK